MTSARSLVLTAIIELPLIQKGDNLSGVLLEGLSKTEIQLQDQDVLVIAQKIVSKAEGRIVNLSSVPVSEKAKKVAQEAEKDPRLVELILQESNRILRLRPGLIIAEHRLGFVCANAGIDSSNVTRSESGQKDSVLLLPENPEASARRIRDEIKERATAEIGVLIIDSHGRPFREGAVGVALGAAGIPPLLDLRGVPDMFGDPLVSTRVGAADELASAASILMGQAGEGYPAVHVRGLPYQLQEGTILELIRPKEKDLFRN